MSALHIRPVTGVDEYPALAAIWRRAVSATHAFLDETDRREIDGRLIPDYFPAVTLSVAEREGRPAGFSGVMNRKLEMLFVDDDERGSGVGTALLDHAVDAFGVTEVDVNEQNVAAADFYVRRGFCVVGRSETDAEGRPYPLLHLRSTERH
jgi:putative acetyltransferase